jgi:hypothetical protein
MPDCIAALEARLATNVEYWKMTIGRPLYDKPRTSWTVRTRSHGYEGYGATLEDAKRDFLKRNHFAA